MAHFSQRFFVLPILAVLLFSFGSIPSASALTATSGKDVSLKNPLTDDFYAVGGEVDIDQPVTGDVVVLGGVANIAEDVSGDVLVFGGRVNISGNVGDDVKIFGGNLTVSGNIKDDLVAAGGMVELTKTGSVGGTVLVYGGGASIDGNVAENVKGSAGIVKIKGWINGSVQVDAKEYLSISPLAKIRGDLKYSSENPAVIPANVVSGKTERMPPPGEMYKGLLLGFFTVGMLAVKLWNFLSLLLLGALLFIFFPHELQKWPDGLRKHFLKNLGIGFIALTAGSALVVFCAATIIGLPVALILGFGGVAVWYASQLVAGLFLGTIILKTKPRSPRRTYGVLALGLFIYEVISLVPVIGPLVTFILVLASFGVLLRRKYEFAVTLRANKK